MDNQQSISLQTSSTVDLKAMVYDLSKQINNWQQAVQAIETELINRAKAAESESISKSILVDKQSETEGATLKKGKEKEKIST